MITRDEIVMETVPDQYPDTSYLEQEGFEERLQQHRDGRFGFIGIRASCTLNASPPAIPRSGYFTASRAPDFGVSNPTPNPPISSRCSRTRRASF